MFPSPLWVMLATLVLFNQVSKIENTNDFNSIMHFEYSTNPPSKIELFRPNITLNEKVDEGNYENNSTSETNDNSIFKRFTSRISNYLKSYFISSCETSGNILYSDDEVCLCKNSTLLFFFKKNDCFKVKVKVSNNGKKNQDGH